MQINTQALGVPRYLSGRSSQENLDQVSTFARNLSDQFAAQKDDPAAELSLLRLSSRLKNEVLEQVPDYDPQSGAFRSTETALRIALAAAGAGVVDAVIYSQTRDTPFTMLALPTADSEQATMVHSLKKSMDVSANTMVNFSLGQAQKPDFAQRLIPRRKSDLVEDLEWGTAGPEGYFQMGYWLGALSGTAATAG